MYFEMKIEIGLKYGVTKWPDLPDGVFAFMSGDRIAVTVPEPVVFLVDNTSKHPPADFASSFMPVFSNKLVQAFRSAGVDNFQTYKAVLKNPDTGESWDNYQVVNILGKIACADMENSVYTVMMGVDCEFSELVIDVEKANGALFFRLLESHDKIIVHNDVLNYMFTKDDDPIFEGIEFDPIKSKQNL